MIKYSFYFDVGEPAFVTKMDLGETDDLLKGALINNKGEMICLSHESGDSFINMREVKCITRQAVPDEPIEKL